MREGAFGPGLLARLLASLAELRFADRAMLEAASEVVLSKIGVFANNADNLAEVLEAFQKLGHVDERLQQLTDAYGIVRAAEREQQQQQQQGEEQR
jgi:cation transport regulator ChaC